MRTAKELVLECIAGVDCRPVGRAHVAVDEIFSVLTTAGLVIVPKEPTPKMTVCGVHGDDEDAQTYRQMVAAYVNGAV